jgi:hypothetical protein
MNHTAQMRPPDPAVNPWLTPTGAQCGCTRALEAGDPVVGFGFTVPMNSNDGSREKAHRVRKQENFTDRNNFADVAHGCS